MRSAATNNIQVLCTRPVNEALVELAAQQGITIDIHSFIVTGPVETVEVQQEIESALILSATVVFTSMNAVEAVAANLFDEQPHWNIYCIGQATQELVKKYFGLRSVAGTADSAAELAMLIVDEAGADEVLFFCGDRRREALPQILRQNNIDVTEVVVYQTIAVPHKLTKIYNGVLFFSPSAVQSFFSSNKTGRETVFFAIGETTAAAIRKYTGNEILIAAEPGKEQLVLKAISYFKHYKAG